MKKVWLVVALTALGGLAANTFADVQNIRLSGDIRIRGYYMVNVGGDAVEDQLKGADSFISQRTRVCVEADLEDHVLAVVTLKAEGLWGQDNDAGDSSGAGTGGATGNDAINRRWEVGVTEAYLQLNEVFYSAATLKLGRQYLNYGRGLIFSSVEQEYNFDAARLVLDYYPFTLDLVYAALLENSVFGAPSTTHPNDLHVLFANARYEMTDSLLKNVEFYFGYLINSSPVSTSSRVPPSAGSASPFIAGLRADMNLTEGLNTWAEAAYEWGNDGTAGNDTISAWLVNLGGRFSKKDWNYAPSFNANYTFASGGGSGGSKAFRPWFNYVDGNNGYLFQPMLSNIHIFNLGATVKPAENLSASLQAYYYLAADKTPGLPGAGLKGDPNVDFGGLGFSPSGSSRELGWEVDAILGYDYSKDVRAQLVYAVFIPENDFHKPYPSDSMAHLVRGEVNVKF
ncbi:MAG: hypothetical protein PCFJNLEI_00817 [Verrucomicrobiae bacterium]|nr:hypothetical protein [Verrucomicrobiae bacterium]